jgi:hypothetical protein
MNFTPTELAQLSKQLKQDIDSWCEWYFDDGARTHLGASEIGNPCSKYLWLKFRWTFYKKHSGRMQRLLNRGHFEEARFIQYLEGIGCKVTQFDEEAIARGETDKGKMQLRISACKGHFGGSLDAEVELPTRYNIPGKLLCELKTQGLGKQGNKVSNFDKLVKEGVKLYKPVHWAQQCIYGYKCNLEYGIYLSVCKNNDELHLEVIKLDHFYGASLEKKAEMIIFAKEAPAGISSSPSYYECTYCDAKDVCFNGKPALRNCRSCCNSEPIDNAEWQCRFYGIIPKEHIPTEKPCWESIV